VLPLPLPPLPPLPPLLLLQSEEAIKELLVQAMQRWGMRVYNYP
jgi:hypothetical protein